MSKLFLKNHILAAITLIALLSPSQAQEVDQSEQIHTCDQLSAYQYDPFAITAGVLSEHLDGRATIAACMSAIQSDPEELRFRFQLARGYIADGKKALGYSLIDALANKKYPAAYLMLGIAHHEGDGATLNHRVAVKWYKKAYKAGVIQAADELAKLYADPQSPQFDIEDSFEWAEKAQSESQS